MNIFVDTKLRLESRAVRLMLDIQENCGLKFAPSLPDLEGILNSQNVFSKAFLLQIYAKNTKVNI